jgi:G3E family GTPase
MLIESTGVANPSDLKKDLKLPIFNDRFRFMEQFCVIDAAHFLDAYGAFASVEKQIASSTVFIINKIDCASAKTIAETKNIIRQFHSDPAFFETTYADIPLGDFFDLSDPDLPDSQLREPENAQGSVLSEQALDQFIDNLLDSPDLEISPPDMLMSVTYVFNGNDLEQVRAMAEALPPSVVRAKGFVAEKGKVYLFNYVMGDWTIEKTDVPRLRIKNKNRVVFIGPPDSMKEIEEASKTGDWIGKGAFQPYTPS